MRRSFECVREEMLVPAGHQDSPIDVSDVPGDLRRQGASLSHERNKRVTKVMERHVRPIRSSSGPLESTVQRSLRPLKSRLIGEYPGPADPRTKLLTHKCCRMLGQMEATDTCLRLRFVSHPVPIASSLNDQDANAKVEVLITQRGDLAHPESSEPRELDQQWFARIASQMLEFPQSEKDRCALVVFGCAETKDPLVYVLTASAGVTEHTPPGLKSMLSCSWSPASYCNDRILENRLADLVDWNWTERC